MLSFYEFFTCIVYHVQQLYLGTKIIIIIPCTSQADELEKELKKEDPDPSSDDLKILRKQLHASHAAALDAWQAAESSQAES